MPSRAAVVVIVIGAIAAVLVAVPWTVFDLDRFLVPKELVLHLTALIAGALTLRRMRADRLLIAFLVLSALSAVLAQNKWLGFRALAISASSVVLFWAARTLEERPLVNGLAVAVIVALILPNALHWRSRNPYLQTASNVADYERGSGRGRLVQYQRSLRMAAQHALLGVGPGNWAVDYPRHAARNDPSLSDSEAGVTS